MCLVHSIREGRVSGALIMGKIGSYARQNKVAKALNKHKLTCLFFGCRRA
ncbi:Tn3 family transposase [Paenibacillus sp. LMG 31460]|uniref:Tn3 family transposase n=1 Tax=Paenibacillus germinis TaxID=2654979 RepID=A0ABX1ZAC6_9BACL|nr:Tn3 family transposase [Paenibacillus germinis]